MPTLRIYDRIDLRDVLARLVPRSLDTQWVVSPVKAGRDKYFEVIGNGAERLVNLAHDDALVSGTELANLAKSVRQIIWGKFAADWLTIRAIDSSFYEVTTSDEAALNKIQADFKDVRLAKEPWTFVEHQ